jgi:L-lactate utilization protein LutB
MNYNTLPELEIIEQTANAVRERGIEVFVVDDKKEALEKIKDFIPAGASVNNGSSRTLQEIGFIDYLKDNKHGWNNLHEAVISEKDPEKQAGLRRMAVFSDYYLGSVHAIAKTGEIIIASASGSQLPHIVYTSQNLIFVVGAQKIADTFGEAMSRVRDYVVPLEDKRMKDVELSPG